jgi:mannose-6-phosphate isomerase-like protein (cupin superfamily)
MKPKAISISDKFKLFDGYWTPKVIASLNDYQFKVARFSGEFIWHSHENTDEAFIVIEGEMGIKFRDGITEVSKGQLIVVPKGVEHKPFANGECLVLIVEPSGVANTGDKTGNLTAPNDVWI